MGPMVEPHPMSLRVTNCCKGSPIAEATFIKREIVLELEA
jgi:hypothetical protein